ncbi:hypothetical protein I7819_19860 [Burkholderia multivorans]|uniref:hypothetical protein n=1 Tax=Burkholderia multivorans TaxID=87883 RepID=UPI0018C451AF|nr:hypothetical protein [Burkholderia multivorans]MBJ9942129.1 hypothetical protein [Burkholderia multivorans]MBU9284334.1 hypothetical protein [Burkholderia multivorans]
MTPTISIVGIALSAAFMPCTDTGWSSAITTRTENSFIEYSRRQAASRDASLSLSFSKQERIVSQNNAVILSRSGERDFGDLAKDLHLIDLFLPSSTPRLATAPLDTARRAQVGITESVLSGVSPLRYDTRRPAGETFASHGVRDGFDSGTRARPAVPQKVAPFEHEARRRLKASVLGTRKMHFNTWSAARWCEASRTDNPPDAGLRGFIDDRAARIPSGRHCAVGSVEPASCGFFFFVNRQGKRTP